ncbi:DHA2 family efflux MFS transporter permease subunit [Novosphingobium sp. Gsoil 351]|uniref:DHA2 family efflux MFS transporter permease subunit n=1 Tax=Novosphingobium sp. Gsoil 351 TaxID=2675225 RepID=UPI0012B4F56E|nr:DHA2 family efflux MFS transporter permease subunit [Novosphingobium sp. Gsoil 351]QGN55732.1 DHA2 family efflux MFS transporter permease subunit [Novosphingobium sp. Gsoil 351]
MTAPSKTSTQLSGGALVLAGVVLAVTNFMVVLDTTIANVSVAHIAGGLGISSSEGTWVITSYAVAEAICVPLTGWLSRRFGTVRVFAGGMLGFGIFSFLCGTATSLAALVAFRIGQGICGGPLMALSQTLLLRVFPKDKHAMTMGIWAMTTLTAPIFGPILGGTISDSWGWHWIFFINIPIAIVCSLTAFAVLSPAETERIKDRIDGVGLALLVLWVGALQLMLDLGREHDWFGSTLIVNLAIVAAVGFAAFLIWELTEDQPAVDLRPLRHRGFAVAVIALVFAYGTFFASLVVIPQWLQGAMGYTATWAGYATAFNGVAAVLMAPVVAKRMTTVDPRRLVFIGVCWLSATSLLRVFWWNSGSDFWTLALPQLIQGAGMPFFFVPLTTIALGAVDEEETASAAGVMNFLRTMAGAVAVAISTTLWYDGAQEKRAALSGVLNGAQATIDRLVAQGYGPEQARMIVSQLVDKESVALATGQTFVLAAAIFAAAASIIWLAPRPTRQVDTSAAH